MGLGIDGLVVMKLIFGIKVHGIKIKIRKESKVFLFVSSRYFCFYFMLIRIQLDPPVFVKKLMFRKCFIFHGQLDMGHLLLLDLHGQFI